MRALFLINPTSGRGRALRRWRELEPLIAGNPAYEAILPASAAETRALAARAAREGMDRVVVIGGDGTLAAVAGELAGTQTSVGFIPGGTGNDFCRNVGLPTQPDAALAVATGSRTRPIDLGMTGDGRHFINIAGVGFDAEVGAIAARYPRGLGGNLPYLLGTLRTMAWYRPMPTEITVDGVRHAMDALMVGLANGRYYGGGMQLAPGASLHDGMLDVVIIGSMGRLEMLKVLGGVYSGAHLKHPRVQVLQGRRVSLQVPSGTKVHVDGDHIPLERLDFEARPASLLVAVPEAFAQHIS